MNINEETCASDQDKRGTMTRRLYVTHDRTPVERGDTPSLDHWITPAEAAAILGLGVDTLRSYRSKHKELGPAFSKVGYFVLYRRADVEAFLLQRGEG